MVAGAVGIASMVLGGGRERAEDGIDHAVGIICRAKPGELVKAGETVYEVHYRTTSRMLGSAAAARRVVHHRRRAATGRQPLVLEEIA